MRLLQRSMSVPVLIAILVAIKSHYLIRFGPLTDSGDFPHYYTYASLILGDGPWLGGAGLDEFMREATLFRMIGYPAVIALARLMSEQHWAWIIAVCQVALSIYACTWVYRLGLTVAERAWVAFAAGLTCGLSLSLRFDQMILTDSFAGSLLIIAFCILSLAVLERRPVGLGAALTTGLLIVAAFLLRDTVRAIAFFYVPLILVAVWRIRPVSGAAIRAVLVLGPFLATVVAYQSWNEARTGDRFITTIPHSGYLISMMNAKAAGTEIFSEDTPLDRVAREEFKRHDFLEVLLIVRRLQLEYRMTEPQVMFTVEDKYKQAWQIHTDAMLKEFIIQFSPKHMLYVISPLFSDLDLRTRTQGQFDRPSSAGAMAKSLISEGTIGAWLLLGVYAVQAISSVLVTVVAYFYPLFLVGMAARCRRLPDERAQLLFALWLFYWGMVALIAMSWFEPRYTIPVMPIIAVTGLAGLAHLVEWFHTRRSA